MTSTPPGETAIAGGCIRLIGVPWTSWETDTIVKGEIEKNSRALVAAVCCHARHTQTWNPAIPVSA